MEPMYRKIWLPLLAAALVSPGAGYAMAGKDAKKDGKVQADSTTKSRKAKTGQETDADDTKKKLKPGTVPHTPAPSSSPNVRPQDQQDDTGDQLWDTDFLVRRTIPTKRGTMVVFANF
jgi:hypothetical protein